MNPLRSNKRLSGHFTPSTPPAAKQPTPSTPQPATPAAINNDDDAAAAAPPEILYSVMGTSNPPSLAGSIAPAASETRKDEHDRNIKSINDEILALQRSVDHKLELIRHLVASREVAVAHEVELSRIDQEYADEEGRKKVLLRVESFTGGGKSKEKEKEGKGGEGGKQKKKLISYAKRGTVKRGPGAKEGQTTA
ncbi:uncharacterized protein LAJ45_08236 [Morchella importuna]|nr:uncharacterized protein LAJ45_08236 [Morchella importuna]KAH8147770.1 hypothetical protein LAJ45_08236 [Morchella importuna]